jgi:hypothetical protein
MLRLPSPVAVKNSGGALRSIRHHDPPYRPHREPKLLSRLTSGQFPTLNLIHCHQLHLIPLVNVTCSFMGWHFP